MKKKVLLFLAALLSIGSAWADDEITVPNVEIRLGQEGNMEIKLTKTTGTYYRDFEFVLSLPEGITVEETIPAGGTIPQPAGTVGDAASYHTVASSFIQEEEPQVIKYVLSNTAGAQINGGVIITIPLKSASTLNVDEELDASINNVVLSWGAPGEEHDAVRIESIPFKIKIIENRITLDENVGITSETPTGLQNVLVKRTISANNWNTICLPFGMSAEQIASAFGDATVQLADFAGCVPTYDEEKVNCLAIKVNFTDATTITANKPCLIKVNKAVTEFKVDEVTINANEESAHVDKDKTKIGSRYYYNKMIGTYTPETVIGNSEDDFYQLFLSNNKFYYSKGTAKMKAFRAYFEFLDELTDKSAGVSNAKISFFVDETTGISDIKSKTKVDSDAVYNINGQYVGKNIDMNTLPKGVYIINGKKKIVK